MTKRNHGTVFEMNGANIVDVSYAEDFHLVPVGTPVVRYESTGYTVDFMVKGKSGDVVTLRFSSLTDPNYEVAGRMFAGCLRAIVTGASQKEQLRRFEEGAWAS